MQEPQSGLKSAVGSAGTRTASKICAPLLTSSAHHCMCRRLRVLPAPCSRASIGLLGPPRTQLLLQDPSARWTELHLFALVSQSASVCWEMWVSACVSYSREQRLLFRVSPMPVHDRIRVCSRWPALRCQRRTERDGARCVRGPLTL